jgi:hypothetical protein
MATELECPVDFIPVNENKVRLTALHVFILAILYLFLSHWSIMAFLVIDFFLRGFNWGKYSVLSRISEKEVQLFHIKSKPIDQAPKRFAAKIGFFFCAAILLSNVLDYGVISIALTVVMLLFSFLESFLGICAGCYAYTFYRKFFTKKTAIQQLNGS